MLIAASTDERAALPRERPILFSATMVRALLDGTKTQTRRVLAPKVAAKCPPEPGYEFTVDESGYCVFTRTDRFGFSAFPLGRSVYGAPGDRLWVRETLRLDAEHNIWRYAADGAFVEVAEDQRAAMVVWAHHKPGEVCTSTHMPRWASRITLEIADVRVQRVQDITNADARAEGVPCWVCGNPLDGMSENDCACFHNRGDDGLARNSFEVLWDSINSERPGCSWKANPWVWALTFRRIGGSPC